MQDYNGIFEEYIQTKNQLVQQEALLSTLSSHAKFTQTLIQSINNSIQKYSYPQNHTLFKPLSNIIKKFNDESNQSISRITGGIINPIEEFQQNTSVINTTELKDFNGTVDSQEIGLPVSSNGLVLPCGASGRWEAK